MALSTAAGLALSQLADQKEGSFDRMNAFAKHMKKDRPTPLWGQGTKMMEFLMANRDAGNPLESDKPKADFPGKKEAFHSSHPEALKTAIRTLGIKSEVNPHGLDIDFDTAKEIYHGGEELSDIEITEFRSMILKGDESFDQKRMRMFSNQDGSTTYEMLNPDKSVMSRFTFGNFRDRKVFAQGGYSAYAKEIRKMTEQSTEQQKAMLEFDDLRARIMMSQQQKERRNAGEALPSGGSQEAE